MSGPPDGDLPGTRTVASPVAPPGAALPAGPVRRVRKAYEQVYDQLRDWIIRGDLSRGARLPSEAVLAREFGVSRGTVREALRVLAAQNLIRTAKGAGGGSFVTLPTVDHISDVPAREHQPPVGVRRRDAPGVPGGARAARGLRRPPVRCAPHAGGHRPPAGTMVADPAELGTSAHYILNKEFHTAVLDGVRQHARVHRRAARLLRAADAPAARADARQLRRAASTTTTGRSSRRSRPGDSDAAGEEMRKHIEYLSGIYSGHVARHARQRLTGRRRC